MINDRFHRRRLITLAAGGLAALLDARMLTADTVDVLDLPMTGDDDRRLRSFDRLLASFITLHEIPGAAAAVTKNGRLVYARGFGWADVENKERVQPASLFRIASLSKPITAVAVLQLVERGKLSLDDKAFPRLDLEPQLADGAKFDARLNDITVRQLLQHTAGFDRAVSFDPMVGEPSVKIAKAFCAAPPASCEQIIRYMLGRPLDFAPGERFAYSNFGYCVLGRVIEKVSGLRYDEYVKQEVLAPLGIRSMQIGKTLAVGRAPGEVKYYDRPGRTGHAVVGEKIGAECPVPYGAWYLEAMDAHGGWIASAVDLARFASAFDEPAKCKILSQASIETMFARPGGAAGFEADGTAKTRHYGCGWSVIEHGNKGGANHWHTGGLDGTSTLMVRRADGLNWVVLLNAGRNEDGEFYCSSLDPLMHRAADAVTEWPERDLFGE
jgi:N-acyl-D-amino-acid deacylase